MEAPELQWAAEAAEKIKKKMPAVVARSGHKIPYTTENGIFDDWTKKNINWWTNGFWGGILWQLYHATGMELYKEAAIENEEKLDANLLDPFGMDHDSGFKWLPTAVAHYRETGDDKAFRRGYLAAENLAGRYNPAGEYIRAWNDPCDGKAAGTAIIDCMMNLPLLYWAYEATKDPRFYHIAVRHADTVMKYFVREDSSVIHIAEFDPLTGEFLRSVGGQGCGHGSSWTRGQAWALYGFTLSYLHTNKEKYLHQAERIADRFIERIPDSGFIPVDFCQPQDCIWEDSTAAAIAACGLLELAKTATEMKKEKYRSAALGLLKQLCEKRCNFSEDVDYILENCTAAYHDKDHNFTIIYGDYFLIEALFKLTGEELFIW